MQVSVETLSDLERRVTVQVPAERLDKDIQNRLQSLSRQVKVHGFRPGKVPLKVVKRMYGDQVRYEAVSELLKDTLHDALNQQKLSPLGSPRIEAGNLEEGQDFQYSATFEVLPEFDLTGFETIKVERPVVEVSDQDVDNMVLNLREQRATWHEVDRPSRETDRLRVDFEGLIDEQPFPGNKGENTSVILGKSAVLKDFETRLIGLSAGEETGFDLTFPQDYQAQEIAGKTAHFRVKLHSVEQMTLPDVDDAFAESFDIKESGTAGLKQSLRKNMERELREGIKAAIKRQVMQGLLDANPITLPKVLIETEIENLASQLHFPANSKGDDKNQEIKAQLFEPEARRRVALGLLISRLATTQAIKPDEQRVRDYVETMASTYEDPSEVLRWYEKTPQALENVRALALEDGVVDWLLERAQVVDKVSTFAEVMASGRQ